MNLNHHFTLPAALDQVWAAVNHVELVAPCFPGASLVSVSGHDFSGGLKLKLGALTMAYVGTGTFVERSPGRHRLVVRAEGLDRRGKGQLRVTATMALKAQGVGTAVDVSLSGKLTGQPEQIGAEVVEDAVRRMYDQFAGGLTERFAEGLGPEAMRADASDSYSSALGQSASSTSTRHAFNPLSDSSRTDVEAVRDLLPIWAKRYGPPVLGVAAVGWIVRRVRRR